MFVQMTTEDILKKSAKRFHETNTEKITTEKEEKHLTTQSIISPWIF